MFVATLELRLDGKIIIHYEYLINGLLCTPSIPISLPHLAQNLPDALQQILNFIN